MLGLLAGCAGPRPAPPSEAAVVPPPAWRTSAARSDADVSPTWWEAFGDPGLTRIVAAALDGNDDIRIAAARVAQLMARSELARAQRLPDVSGAWAGQRSRSVGPFATPQTQTASEPVVTLSFDADLFGRLRFASDAVRAELLATRAAQADVRLLVAATAARLWFTLRALDARLATLRETVAARQETLRLMQRRVAAGYAAQLELTQADAELRSTEQQVPVAELGIQRTEDALSLLLGRNPGPIERGEPLLQLARPAVPATLPSALLRRRPDIVEAEERLVAADRSLDASRAAFMPDLQLSANLGRVSSSLLASPITVFTLGASILAPIFDAGRLRAQQDASAALRDETAFAYRKAVLNAFAEVEDSLAATQRLREQLDALLAQEQALRRSFQIASERYRAGYSPFLDQLDAQRNLLSVQLAVAQARADQLNAYVTLFQAFGGGWDRSQMEAAGK
ncbi:MAG: transporter [Ramlibacter sp.]|nr:transporter [Ramlibacter sp.]